ncbi:MAG: haloacid dehalogenase-like hydrolase, partial [Methanomassiliicoccales archaeon]
KALVDRCSSNEIPFHIASAGLDFVIDHYLERAGVLGEVEVHALRSSWDGRTISLDFPHLKNEGARSFKEDVVIELRKRGKEAIYIGDGLSDLDGARSADITYAVKGRPLGRLLSAMGIDSIAFENFGEIIESMGL